MKPDNFKPFLAEVEEAGRNPNGWVYRIGGRFGPNDQIPKEAIIGAWKVNAQGKIVGNFVKNQHYDAKRWPPGYSSKST
jgi:hypothetical protein